jgi:hypothetical protein
MIQYANRYRLGGADPSYLFYDRFEYMTDPGSYTQVGSEPIVWGHTPALAGARSVKVESGVFGAVAGMYRVFTESPLAVFGFYGRCKLTSAPTANTQLIMLTGNATALRTISLSISTGLHVAFGSIDAVSAYENLGLSVGDEIHIWADYSSSDFANNVDFYISTTGSKPAAPTRSLAAGARSCGAIHLTSARRLDPVWDDIIIHDSFLPSHPFG